jgi:mannose-6-phosphate isomerase-like protein (cupin superfamily)
MPIKEPRKVVEKVWGYELWLVNCDEYCSKLLIVDRKAECSYHCHKDKKETFTCLEGGAILTIEGEEFHLLPWARSKTIFPGEYHSFRALKKTVILEVSTHHEDDDSFRLTESKPGIKRKRLTRANPFSPAKS